MEVDFAFICDYAHAGQKLSAIGIGFNTIAARQLPAVHPQFHMVAQLRASVAEAGQKDFTIRLIDADGKDVVPAISGKFNVPRVEGATEATGRLAVAFNNTRFPAYAHYSLHLVVQGNEMVRIPLRVVAAPPSGNHHGRKGSQDS